VQEEEIGAKRSSEHEETRSARRWGRERRIRKVRSKLEAKKKIENT